MFELDHILIGTDDAATSEQALVDFGISLSVHREHRGQGTRNACALFQESLLELLYEQNLDELQSDLVAPLGLWERIHWKSSGACPFGFCFRPTAGSGEPFDLNMLPFEMWRYEAAYLPKGASIPIVTPPRCLHEPLIFIGTWGTAPRTWKEFENGLPRHLGQPRELAHFQLHVPPSQAEPSSGFRWFVDRGLIPTTKDSDEPRLEIQWGSDSATETAAFHPQLPLALRW